MSDLIPLAPRTRGAVNAPVPTRELSLDELLADPIINLVMTRDRVTREHITGLIGIVRSSRVR